MEKKGFCWSHVVAFCLCFLFAPVCYAQEQEENALICIEKAKEGDPAAQHVLACCYANGNELPQDIAQAVYWWRLAGEQGDAKAQCNLGICYMVGAGVEKDVDQAVSWWRKAADQGLAEAQYNMGITYENGDGVDKDISEAVRWYRKSADQGYVKAQVALSRLERTPQEE